MNTMQHSQPLFLELEKIKYPLVNQFYKRVYKKAMASKDEMVFILKNEQGIICSAKLKSIDEHLLLTGVACDSNYQQQGYATFLLKKLLARQQQTVFCFPYPHLQLFYQRVGFKLLTLRQAPQSIQQRFDSYTQRGELLLMVYHH